MTVGNRAVKNYHFMLDVIYGRPLKGPYEQTYIICDDERQDLDEQLIG
jgi:hypothetical protein